MDSELLDFGPTIDPISGRPIDEAPSRSADYDERAAWSARYVAWFIEQMDEQASWASDVSATHRYEIEFNSCVMDPYAYEQQTAQELEPRRVH